MVVKMTGEVKVPAKTETKSLAPTNKNMAPKTGH